VGVQVRWCRARRGLRGTAWRLNSMVRLDFSSSGTNKDAAALFVEASTHPAAFTEWLPRIRRP